MAPLMLFLIPMRWRVLFIAGAIAVPLGCAEHAASAPPAGATSQPRFIREAQRSLGELGYRPGPIDGVVGRRTRDALARYQRAQKIPVTGSLDAETMVRLDIHERVSGPASRLESEVSRTFETNPNRPIQPTARAAR
jgi:peptidoglycan hydrolase-like protein with peptidoglycan-binding domain